ncbi:Trimethylguanosine synthase [Vitis vinifera]|uniref:Trimethylguanosine synthase n=1 Tax=Vitis vinifera TaxID=29760 RepID=A0A438EN12_VITVI|nr:Trimethylguanosine synthase [Vitis vinifera]
MEENNKEGILVKIKGRKRTTEKGISPLVEKYWLQRYNLFSSYDDGIKMDEEGWFSVTPEEIAIRHAERSGGGCVIDCFSGVGGNTIQFAKMCHHVVAIDLDPHKVELAFNNAKIYGVEDYIDFIIGDFFQLASSLKFPAPLDCVSFVCWECFIIFCPTLGIHFFAFGGESHCPIWRNRFPQILVGPTPTFDSENAKMQVNKGKGMTPFPLIPQNEGDVAFLAPPWGGPSYKTIPNFSLDLLKPKDGYSIFQAAQAITPNIIMFLPRNVDLRQVEELSWLSSPPLNIEIEENYVQNHLKGITAYFGVLHCPVKRAGGFSC